MSLINKMLQDLDARGGAADDGAHAKELKPVPAAERERRTPLLAGGAAGLVVLAAAGWYGWHAWHAQRAPAGPEQRLAERPAPAVSVVSAPAIIAAPAPEAASAVASVSANEAPPAPVAAAAPAAPGAGANAGRAPAGKDAVNAKRVPSAAVRMAARDEQADAPPGADRPHKAARPQAAKPAPADGAVLRDAGPGVVAENTYRRGLAALQEGRVNQALTDLERAVEINPRHEAARQTYISLLLEVKRPDDAVRQLRLALGINPRQPGLAMVLARLQLERGGPALDTLMKTLPYAGDSADYQAFLAGVLQREQRNAEAIKYYRAALAISPQNGVWWMGLGISLQAEKQLPEARDAYARARASSGLNQELQTFVDRKLEQLSR